MSQEQSLEELTALTTKYQIVVGGCGCCGSPFLLVMNINDVIAENLKFEGKKYSVNGGDVLD